ncbi:MAG TPA: hypothetical protein ENI08_01645 [Candidatus Dependentiae bacterium]|nr:hypothetical protein [Candidatus Dependentiae bacterium]
MEVQKRKKIVDKAFNAWLKAKNGAKIKNEVSIQQVENKIEYDIVFMINENRTDRIKAGKTKNFNYEVKRKYEDNRGCGMPRSEIRISKLRCLQ